MAQHECHHCGSTLDHHSPPVCDGCYESLSRARFNFLAAYDHFVATGRVYDPPRMTVDALDMIEGKAG